MRQSYVKNAVLLTGSSLVLRLAGMAFRIYLANALGDEGMGLYQLILAFYSVFITLATSGVSVAVTRLVAEELSRGGAVRAMVRRLCTVGLLLGTGAAAAQYALAGPAARWWLGDARAVQSIRVLAVSLPFMALAAVLRGAFLALRRVGPNVISQLAEQGLRITAVMVLLRRMGTADVAVRCKTVFLCEAVSEVFSAGLMVLFYGGECRRMTGQKHTPLPPGTNRRIWQILWPVEGGRCLSSGLHTAENMLVPACLAVYLSAAGGRAAALAQYGVLKGMALPLLFFPFGLLGSLATLLMPEITEAHTRGSRRTLNTLLDRMLTLTMYAAMPAGAAFWVCGGPLARLLYHSAEAGFYLRVLAPVMPLMYLENMIDGAIKGIGEQKAAFAYAAWDSALRIAGVVLLLPRIGMAGFLLVMCCSNLFTCLMNTRRLLRVTGLSLRLGRWMAAPGAAALLAVLAGSGVQTLLAGQHPAVQVLAPALAMAVVYLPAAWVLGLNRALRSSAEKKSKEFEKSVDKAVRNAYNYHRRLNKWVAR